MRHHRTIRWLGLGLAVLGLLALPTVVFATGLGSEGGGGAFNAFGTIPLIIFIPVAGLLVNLLWGKDLGEGGVGFVASAASAGAFVIALLQFFSLLANEFHAATVPFLDWIVIGELNIPWAFQIDTLSVTMMLVVTGVGTLIHIYAVGYMHGDVRHNGDPARFPRFFVYLNLFLAAMLILVTANNYLMLFVGWEGVGVCSFLLIGFWFEKGEKNVGNARAARKAFVANRVGDWAMLLAMFLIFWNFGSLTFDVVFAKVSALSVETTAGLLTAITILLLIGATGKSAQVPLYVWLPDAMAGPTPVSALIHAATMVTAGIYLITRSNVLFALAPLSQNAVAWVGAITAIFAATMAVAQFDIKKVLAYSTISQLGFMIAAVGLGGYVAGMFHLITHAFFKALLFLGSGSVIHAMEHGMHALHAHEHAHGGGGHGGHDDHDAHGHDDAHAGHDAHPHFDPQDMRNMGGLWNKLPVTKWVYLIGAIALAGIFPFAGFWSKDEILLDAFNHNPGIYAVLTIAAGFTAFYMGRQIFMVFFGKARTPEAKHAGESPAIMLIPLIVLAVLSVAGGALNLPTIAGWSPPGAHALTDWLGHTISAAEGGHATEDAGHETTGDGHDTATEGHETTTDEHGAATTGEHSTGFPLGQLSFPIAIFSTVVALGAIALAALLYQNAPATVQDEDPLRGILAAIFDVLNQKWKVDEIYEALILRPFDDLAWFLAEIVDWRFWHDWFHDVFIGQNFRIGSRLLAEGMDLGFVDAMANGLAGLAQRIGGLFRSLQSGYVRGYALAVFFGVVAIVGYFWYTFTVGK